MNVSPAQTCEDLMQCMRHFRTATLGLAEEHGLTLMQLCTLMAIGHHSELLMGRVADTLQCDASNVTGIVDRLVAQGLMERQECQQDRRAKTLRLTSKGQQMADTIYAQLPGRLGCDALSDAERSAFHAILTKLSAA